MQEGIDIHSHPLWRTQRTAVAAQQYPGTLVWVCVGSETGSGWVAREDLGAARSSEEITVSNPQQL